MMLTAPKSEGTVAGRPLTVPSTPHPCDSGRPENHSGKTRHSFG